MTTVRIAFDTDPLDAVPVWTEVDALELHTKRGRQFALGRMEAGTATLVIPNSDGKFWPDKPGPYFGMIDSGKAISIQKVYNGVTYPIYTGFIDSWEAGWAEGKAVPTMKLECSDFLAFLAGYSINHAGFAEELSGVRVGKVLDVIGWPAGTAVTDFWLLGDAVFSLLGTTTYLAGTVGSGTATVAATGAMVNVNALSHLYEVQDAERGILFMGADGTVQFHDRYYRFYNSSIPAASFGGVNLDFIQFTPIREKRRIQNIVRVNRTGGTEQEATDAASVTRYGPRVLPLTLILATDPACLGVAQYILAVSKDGRTEIPSIVLMPDKDPTNLYPVALGLDISERVNVAYAEASIDMDCYIEGVRHDYTCREDIWRTTWQLSPADAFIFWRLGEVGFSEIGETTILGY